MQNKTLLLPLTTNTVPPEKAGNIEVTYTVPDADQSDWLSVRIVSATLNGANLIHHLDHKMLQRACWNNFVNTPMLVQERDSDALYKHWTDAV